MTRLILLPLLVWTAVAVCLPIAHADDTDLDKVRFKYEVEREQIQKPMANLRAKYKARMTELRGKFLAEGDLAKVLAAETAAKSEPDPEVINAEVTEIASAQKIFLQQKDSRVRQEQAKMIALNQTYREQLSKLRTNLTKARKIEESRAVDAELEILNEQIAASAAVAAAAAEAAAEPEKFTSVRVSSSHELSVHELLPDARRLSGCGPECIFEKVSEELDGAKFTRVPWSAKPIQKVTAKDDGYIYMFSVSKEMKIDADVKMESVRGLITGPYLDNGSMYRVSLLRGQSFSCSGHECGVIAKRITLR